MDIALTRAEPFSKVDPRDNIENSMRSCCAHRKERLLSQNMIVDVKKSMRSRKLYLVNTVVFSRIASVMGWEYKFMRRLQLGHSLPISSLIMSLLPLNQGFICQRSSGSVLRILWYSSTASP